MIGLALLAGWLVLGVAVHVALGATAAALEHVYRHRALGQAIAWAERNATVSYERERRRGRLWSVGVIAWQLVLWPVGAAVVGVRVLRALRALRRRDERWNARTP